MFEIGVCRRRCHIGLSFPANGPVVYVTSDVFCWLPGVIESWAVGGKAQTEASGHTVWLRRAKPVLSQATKMDMGVVQAGDSEMREYWLVTRAQ